MFIVFFSVEADPLKVILVDDNDKEEICINVDLIKQGYAELDVKEDLKTGKFIR